MRDASPSPIASTLARRASCASTSRNRSPALPGGEVYTDDRAPVEWLIDRSILGYAAGE